MIWHIFWSFFCNDIAMADISATERIWKFHRWLPAANDSKKQGQQVQCKKPLFIFILWFWFFILNSVLPSCYDDDLNLQTEYRENYLNHQHPKNNRKNCLQGKGEIMVPSHFGMFFHELIYFSQLKSYPHHTLAVTSQSAHWIWDATDILTTPSTIERRGRGVRLCFHSPF